MTIKKLLVCATFFVGFLFSNAQEVTIKDDQVLLNGNLILKYEKISGGQYSLYSLNGEEILMYRFNNNETSEYQDDDYFILNFLTAKMKIESKNFSQVVAGLGMNFKKNIRKLVSWLIKEKVINDKGDINLEKLEVFYDKYHDNLTERTVR